MLRIYQKSRKVDGSNFVRAEIELKRDRYQSPNELSLTGNPYTTSRDLFQHFCDEALYSFPIDAPEWYPSGSTCFNSINHQVYAGAVWNG